MSVEWNYFNKFDSIEDKYLPVNGEGDTLANQAVTAVVKLVYKYYNDGDVFDNTGYMRGWVNNLSDYANWLYKNLDSDVQNILSRIHSIKDDNEYENLLKDLADHVLDHNYLLTLDNQRARGSIYDCSGPFEFKMTYQDEDDYLDDENDWEEDSDEIDEDITVESHIDTITESVKNIFMEDLDDVYDELDDDRSIAYTYYHYLPNALYQDVADGIVDISGGAMTEASLEAILDKGEYTEYEQDFLRNALSGDAEEDSEDLSESVYKSGNRYKGALPQEPSLSSYAGGMKSILDKRKQFIIDNNVEEIKGDDGRITYRWTKDDHSFEFDTNFNGIKRYARKLIIDGKEVDKYADFRSFKTMSHPFSVDYAFKNNKLRFIDEIIDEAIEKHDELNPDLFDEDHLKPEVKEKIEDIVDHFKENLKEDNIDLEIKDILLVGSNASFNYTDVSDMDVHIIADTSIYEDKADLAAKLYEAYKRLFNNKYDPTIMGHEVEIYVDPDKDHSKSNGVYSVMNDEWVKVPEAGTIPEVNMDEVNEGLEPYIDQFNKIESIEDADKLLDDIYLVRQTGILSDGEYSLGNLIFKEFRNKGYLQKLKDKKVELENKEMSLENLHEGRTNAEIYNYLILKKNNSTGEIEWNPNGSAARFYLKADELADHWNAKHNLDNNSEYKWVVVDAKTQKELSFDEFADSERYSIESEQMEKMNLHENVNIRTYRKINEKTSFKDRLNKLARKADKAIFDVKEIKQVNFSDYEKEIAEIMDRHNDVVDACIDAMDFLINKAKDPAAIQLMKTEQGQENLYKYLEKIAEYESVKSRESKRDWADFKSEIKNKIKNFSWYEENDLD